MIRRFQMIDVFGAEAFGGNPLAVVLDAQDLDARQMLQVARWLNLSETTFVLPPSTAQADYRVRIFTLERELPFAGHPTLGTCQAWLRAGGVPKVPGRIVQECGAGLVPLRQSAEGRDQGRLAFAAPPLLRGGAAEPAVIAAAAKALRIPLEAVVDAQWADNGPGWLAVMLGSAEAVLALQPVRDSAERIEIGVIGPHPAGSETAYEIRTFFSDQHGGVIEDPVTGSFNASVAQWLYASGRVTAPYVAAQGAQLGRAGRIFIDRDETGQVWVGGATSVRISGEISI